MRRTIAGSLLLLALKASAVEPPDCPASADSAVLMDSEPGFSILELRPLPPGGLPLPLDDLSRASALEAARRSRRYWSERSPGQGVTIAGRRYDARRLVKSFEALESLLAGSLEASELRREIEERFDVYQAFAGGGSSGMVTAYYDPVLAVSRFSSPDWAALHSRPPELIRIDPGLGLPFDYGRRSPLGTLIPYFTRREISDGAMAGRGLEIFWTRHHADLLVLQTQGSGWGQLPDGSRRRLSFAGANGHSFRSVGRALIACGLIPPGSEGHDVLNFLKSQTPQREAALVGLNPRAVFFAEQEGSGGPWGSTGIELVAGRSIAVDSSQVPLGLPGLIVSRKPVADEEGRFLRVEGFTRFVFTHDVGSAIRGPVRVDLFWGSGVRAAAEAHRMRNPGRLYVFVLR